MLLISKCISFSVFDLTRWWDCVLWFSMGGENVMYGFVSLRHRNHSNGRKVFHVAVKRNVVVAAASSSSMHGSDVMPKRH